MLRSPGLGICCELLFLLLHLLFCWLVFEGLANWMQYVGGDDV